jgi:hypothetical protein
MRCRSSKPSDRTPGAGAPLTGGLARRLACVLASALALAAALPACGGGQLRTRETKLEDDAGPRVPTDPMSAVPRAGDVAQPGDTVATLRAPIPDDVALALVERVFRAFHARTASLLEPDLDDYVVDLAPEQGLGGRARASWIWELQQRLRNAAFDALDVDQMYRASDVEIYGADDLGLAGRPSRPAAMQNEETLVRIPIATTRVGADVLFGEEILLLLRRDGARYKIRGYGERFPR